MSTGWQRQDRRSWRWFLHRQPDHRQAALDAATRRYEILNRNRYETCVCMSSRNSMCGNGSGIGKRSARYWRSCVPRRYGARIRPQLSNNCPMPSNPPGAIGPRPPPRVSWSNSASVRGCAHEIAVSHGSRVGIATRGCMEGNQQGRCTVARYGGVAASSGVFGAWRWRIFRA
jgi:hypothetical protein